MQHFMDYFSRESGFLGSLIIYFPLAVIIFSLLVTLMTRRVFISPIAVLLVFGSFFLYAYSQFNAAISNFLIPLIGYIILSAIVGMVTRKFLLHIK